MSMTHRLCTSTAIALLACSAAHAQDATIYYETPTIRAGQPVVNPTPTITPAPLAQPVPDAAEAGAPTPVTQATAEDLRYLGEPRVQTSAQDSAVTFVSGGIGASEKQWFDAHSAEYNLKVTTTDDSGHHMAGVSMTLANKAGVPVLDTVTDGPYLLVATPPGTYMLTASYLGETRSQKVALSKGLRRVNLMFHDLESVAP